MPEDTRAQARQQHGVRTAPAMAMQLICVMLARNRIAVNRAARIGFAIISPANGENSFKPPSSGSSVLPAGRIRLCRAAYSFNRIALVNRFA